MTVYILSGARTAIGSFMGTLSQVPAPKLVKVIGPALADVPPGYAIPKASTIV